MPPLPLPPTSPSRCRSHPVPPPRSAPFPRSGHISHPRTTPPPRAGADLAPTCPLGQQDRRQLREVAASTRLEYRHLPEPAWILSTHPHPGLQDQHQHGEVAASTRPGQRHLPELAWILPAVPARISRINTRPRSGLGNAPMSPEASKINTSSVKWPHRPARDGATSPSRVDPTRSTHTERPRSTLVRRSGCINRPRTTPRTGVDLADGRPPDHGIVGTGLPGSGPDSPSARSTPVRRSDCMDRRRTAPLPRAGVDLRERGAGNGERGDGRDLLPGVGLTGDSAGGP